jgi:hypothetical protein
MRGKVPVRRVGARDSQAMVSRSLGYAAGMTRRGLKITLMGDDWSAIESLPSE